MKSTALAVLGCAMLAAAPAGADVFSSQSFDGGAQSLDALPGVNLDVVPGMNGGRNCSEETVPAYSGGSVFGDTKATTCRYGNFSITTTGGSGPRNHLDLTYGGNPPPWEQGWRP